MDYEGELNHGQMIMLKTRLFMIIDDVDDDYIEIDVVKMVIINVVILMVCSAGLGGGISKFDLMLHYIQDILHCLPVLQCIEFKISVWVWQSQLGMDLPTYGNGVAHFRVSWPQKSLFLRLR